MSSLLQLVVITEFNQIWASTWVEAIFCQENGLKGHCHCKEMQCTEGSSLFSMILSQMWMIPQFGAQLINRLIFIFTSQWLLMNLLCWAKPATPTCTYSQSIQGFWAIVHERRRFRLGLSLLLMQEPIYSKDLCKEEGNRRNIYVNVLCFA